MYWYLETRLVFELEQGKPLRKPIQESTQQHLKKGKALSENDFQGSLNEPSKQPQNPPKNTLLNKQINAINLAPFTGFQWNV